MTRTFGKVLVVLDFDWSLVEENSDTWVLQQLGASHIFQRLLSEGEGLHSAPRDVVALPRSWPVLLMQKRS